MAITWQLAQLTYESLADIRAKKENLFNLLFWSENLAESYHDAGWLGFSLKKIAETNNNEKASSILETFFHGKELVSKSFPSGDPKDPVIGDVTVLYPNNLLDFLSVEEYLMNSFKVMSFANLKEQELHKFNIEKELPKLLSFCRKSLKNNCCIVQWLD